jgi:ferredoxin
MDELSRQFPNIHKSALNGYPAEWEWLCKMSGLCPTCARVVTVPHDVLERLQRRLAVRSFMKEFELQCNTRWPNTDKTALFGIVIEETLEKWR